MRLRLVAENRLDALHQRRIRLQLGQHLQRTDILAQLRHTRRAQNHGGAVRVQQAPGEGQLSRRAIQLGRQVGESAHLGDQTRAVIA